MRQVRKQACSAQLPQLDYAHTHSTNTHNTHPWVAPGTFRVDTNTLKEDNTAGSRHMTSEWNCQHLSVK